MYLIKVFIFLLFFVFLTSCNQNLSDDEKKELWSKAQTTGEIYNRSGSTLPNTGEFKDRAMRDAETRLSTGGGLFGKGGLDIMGVINQENKSVSSVGFGMPVNPYLWKASLETINFMPLSSTDPIAGTIITDWYSSEQNIGERCKLNIFVNGVELKTDNLKVLSFCQVLKSNQWINKSSNQEDNIRLENAILNKAKKLKLSAG
tara:strand:- start:1220 stop:1828 length:609 start_codon:yes stop_codon:yes gene_type:complete